jgi:SpoVK/Ycf46/Vps4 family AAA+-type ATPase
LWIKKVKEAMTPEAEAFGIPKPKGAMLVGVPGTSKTVSAEILASYLNIPLLSLDMAKVMGSFVGQSERQIANALRITKSVAPCILVLDEMEKILGGVQSSNSTDSGTLSRVMSQLLNFLQQDNTNVITIMTSNDVSQLPPELTRSGRIDAQWMFDLPNEFERGEIIEIYLKKNKLETDSNTFTYFTTATENFTGAEIKSAVKDAMINSFYRQKANSVENFTRSLTIEDIKSAIDNTVTVWKSNHEKIEAFRTYSKSRYLNASKTLDEIKAESKAKKISNNIKVPKESSNVINIVFGSDK